MSTFDVTPNLEPLSPRIPYNTYRKLFPDDGKLVDPLAYSRADDDDRAIYAKSSHGFVSCVKYAFSDHRPLSLAPHHIWLLIQHAVADHVTEHAEDMREQWVSHEGNKPLVVARDVFSQTVDWPNVIDGSNGFLAQLKANTVPEAFNQLMVTFSTTTSVDRLAGGITVMHTLCQYFSYGVMTACGIPRVRMEGTLEDWTRLLTAATILVEERCTKDFAGFWLPSLTKVLTKLIEQYQVGMAPIPGETASDNALAVDEHFWNTICKSGSRYGSGASTWLDGWFNVFFPYIAQCYNPYCRFPLTKATWVDRPLDADPSNGVDVDYFPLGTRHVTVEVDDVPVKVQAGFVGICEDEFVSPVVGWFVTHN